MSGLPFFVCIAINFAASSSFTFSAATTASFSAFSADVSAFRAICLAIFPADFSSDDAFLLFSSFFAFSSAAFFCSSICICAFIRSPAILVWLGFLY